MVRRKILCALLMISLAAAFGGCSSKSDVTDSAPTKNAGDSYVKTEAAEAAGAEFEGGYAEDFAAEDSFAAGAALEGAAVGDVKTAAAVGTGDPEKEDSEDGDDSKPDLPESGQLTAGEWSDNDNWGFFTNLVNSDKISFPSFGIDPRYRTAVSVKSDDGTPLMDVKVKLFDKNDNLIWSSVTDKNGKAFVFGNGEGGNSVEVEKDGEKQKFTIDFQSSGAQGENRSSDSSIEAVFRSKSEQLKKTDIMFILDTTSSMSDEMLFLQSDFSEIVRAVGTENTRFAVNFYRDEGDEYVTKCSDFTDNSEELQKKLNSESAVGGGDIPEAVAEILNESVFDSSWDDDSVKIAFLIFDAPPHEGKEDDILKAIKGASEKGIRLIPVVSSNAERDTELFGRAAAIVTGGDYIFLTDDSGIGDSHLDPIIGSYEVRKLCDIIIDVINNYKA